PEGPEPVRLSFPGMRAVVMAGGQGARLRPLTSNQPKPMLPIVGQPMMQHIIRLARHHGFTELVATVHFLASVVRNYFGDGSDLGVSLSYVTEREVLDFVPEGSEFDFARDLFPLLLEKSLPIYGYISDRYWTDVGTLDIYMEVQRDVLDRKVQVEMEGFGIRDGVWLGEGG